MNDFFYQMTAPRTLVRQPLAMAADAPGPGRIVARTPSKARWRAARQRPLARAPEVCPTTTSIVTGMP